jgi:Ser/Thr protein kinase RdoA (MazF antagonist)
MTLADEAEEAARAWGGRIVRLIRNRENAVFELALPHQRAALRLHRPGYQDEASIRSELWWCDALTKAGIPVSAPLADRNGALLHRLSNGRFASAILWVEGEPLGEAGRPFDAPIATILARYHALGRLLASLHAATDRMTLPEDFRRPAWDVEGFVGEAPLWGRFWEHPAASDAEAATLRRARAFLGERLTDHSATGDYGLIQADPLRENVFVRGEALSLIDFDDSGFGFRLYDLGVALRQNLQEPGYPSIRDALIEGYGGADTEIVEVMVLARLCASVGWTIPRLAADDPTHRFAIWQAVTWADRVMRPKGLV